MGRGNVLVLYSESVRFESQTAYLAAAMLPFFTLSARHEAAPSNFEPSQLS
jgi:hypothetical protein